MTSGIPGSAYQPRPDTEHRLRTWRHYATAGHPAADIAAQLGISRRTLDQLVVRARRAGHPDAVLHARSSRAGTGTWQLTGRKPRTQRPTGGSDAH